MRFASFFTLGATALTLFSSMPGACAAAIEQRDTASDAISILNGATAQVTPIKAKLIAAYAKTDFNNAASIKTNVLPPLQELNGVLASTAGKINALKGKKTNSKRQIDTAAVAAALAALIREVVAALQPLLNFLSSIALIRLLLGGTLASIGANLNTIALGLGVLVAGVLQIVRTLLADLTGALSGLGLGGLLGGLLGGIGL